MAKLKVVARVTRRAKEQALKLGLTVCAAGRNSASCLPAWDGVTERQLLSLSLYLDVPVRDRSSVSTSCCNNTSTMLL